MSKFKVGDKVLIKNPSRKNFNQIETVIRTPEIGKNHPYIWTTGEYSTGQANEPKDLELYIPYINEEKLKKVLGLK